MPLLVAVGERDTADYRLQSRELRHFWQAHGNSVELMELQGRHHFDAVIEWADPAGALFKASRALLK